MKCSFTESVLQFCTTVCRVVCLVIPFCCFVIHTTVHTVGLIMDSFMETANFFEKAENTLHDISQKVCCGSDVPARQYISDLKDCLARIRVLKV